MPWNLGAEFVLTGKGAAAGISIRYRCLAVEKVEGISCLKVETLDIGRANLRTHWWIAQDTDGNIWQIQQSDEQFDGSWYTESGRWLYMPSEFTVGESLELYGIDPDYYTVVSLSGTASTPYQTFNSCVVTELSEFGYTEQHYISPGFGPVRVSFLGPQNASFELQSVAGFNPPKTQVPQFDLHPKERSILVNTSTEFTANAFGIPKPTYQWQRRKPGSVLWEDLTNDEVYLGVWTPSLQVRANNLEMSGEEFRCQASNMAGAAISQSALLRVHPVPILKITRIWSDQIADVMFNSLPPNPISTGGAGKTSNALGVIFMGASQDGLGHVKGSFELDPPDTPFQDRLVFKLVQEGQPKSKLADGMVGEGTVRFSTVISGDEVACSIQGWIDLNENGELDSELGESMAVVPGRFVILSKSGYDKAIGLLQEQTWHGLAGIPLPIAYRLLDGFLNRTVPEKASYLGLVPVSPMHDLDHNIGVAFQEQSSALIPEYQFDSKSDVAEKLLNSDAVREAVMSIILEHRVQMAGAFEDSGVSQWTLPLVNSVAIEFQQPNNVWWDGWDLYYAFHRAGLEEVSVTIRRDKPDSVFISGVLHDTYDFRWDGGPLSTLASRVQAGFPTLGDAGGVFRLRVVLDGEVSNVRFDRKPMISLNWNPQAEGGRMALKCFHFQGEKSVIEYSGNLKDWTLFKPLSSFEMIEIVDLEDVFNQHQGLFFRIKE